jgi:hypothetical protein
LQSCAEETLDRLEDIFAASPGQTPVSFELCSPDGSVALLKAQQRVKVTPELVESVRQICGDRAVETVAE